MSRTVNYVQFFCFLVSKSVEMKCDVDFFFLIFVLIRITCAAPEVQSWMCWAMDTSSHKWQTEQKFYFKDQCFNITPGMCLDAKAVFWNGTTGAWFAHWPLVICDLMWDLRGLQKAGGSQRANYCDGFSKNQLEEKDFKVSFCFSSLMKWTLTLEQTGSSRVWMDPARAHKGLVFSLSLHLWQYWLLDLSITRQRQQVFAGPKFAELQLKCLWFDYPSKQVCGDKHSLNHPIPLDP